MQLGAKFQLYLFQQNSSCAAKDALEAGIKLLVAIPEHVPIRDTMEALDLAKEKGAVIIGPNTPGIMIPELIKVGIMPPMPFQGRKDCSIIKEWNIAL